VCPFWHIFFEKFGSYPNSPYLCSKKIITDVMTAVQLNAEILRNLGALAEDESMLKRVAKYLRKLVSEKEADPTLLSKEEFFARVDEAREQIKRGEGVEMLPDESLTSQRDRHAVRAVNKDQYTANTQ
jgi:hypothetical protein